MTYDEACEMKIRELKLQLEAAKTDFAKARGLLVASEAVESGLRCDLERVQKQSAAMREAIQEEILDGPFIPNLVRLRNAIADDAGSDYIRREEAKPLVEALGIINSDAHLIDNNWLQTKSDGAARCLANIRGQTAVALAHAKTLGLL